MDQKGIIGILAVLLAVSATGNLTQWQQEHAYICSPTSEVGVFDRLSSTGLTGYWTVNGTEMSKRCTVAWQKLKFNLEPPSTKEWLCSANGCIPK